MSPLQIELLFQIAGERGSLRDAIRPAFIRAEASPFVQNVSNLHCIQFWRPAVVRLEQLKYSVTSELECECDLILYNGSRFRDENLLWFARGYSALIPGGRFIASFSNEIGASRFEDSLAKLFGNIESESKRKCRIFWGEKSNGGDDTLASEWLALGEPKLLSEAPLWTVPGIFSADHIDEGSKLLAASLPPLAGRGADFGSGYGFLSWHILSASHENSIDLYEADRRALECAELALKQYAVQNRASFHWADVLKETPSNFYDWIVMNPPFHTEREAEPFLGEKFILAARRSLCDAGRLFVVGNSHLGYEEKLRESFSTAETLRSEGGFRVWAAAR